MDFDKETAYLAAVIAVALVVFISISVLSLIRSQEGDNSPSNPSSVDCRSVAEQIRSEYNHSLINFTCYPGNRKYAERLDVPTEVKDFSDLRCLCTFIDANNSRRLLPIWQTQGVSGAKVK